MPHRGFCRRVKQAIRHGTSGNGLHGQRSNEFFGGVGHHHLHGRTALHQSTSQFCTLIRCDTATDTEQNLFACQ
ncbi:Uncharacterised protein [Vibrio cholerae]|uniref:Uncharacterized protein n=1 Tax=Vibrio cholerae TaxID=666 RepID=A0A655VHT9_VIBCL|nr:Uncharacterised protein [Vibrio cholerae]CSB67980.1 Uncharacterised protein [Vibrio cholerae]CSB85481.1 Uncharacterised protein [Vibrio cholerae]CSC09444.1 Uncharacterised protein [Vibrio cholerae]CSC50885.1 Uncharacterised protein [Vibrio cholerae]